MNKFKFLIFIVATIIFIVNIYFIINGIIDKPLDSLQTSNSIVNLIMISRINQIIAFVLSIIIILIGMGKTRKEKQLFWLSITINFLNAFSVFGFTKYLSMLNIS